MHRPLLALSIVWASASPALAQTPPPADLLTDAIAAEVVAVERSEGFGMSLRRGFVMHLKPRQNMHGDCRTQQIEFLRRDAPPSAHLVGEPKLDQVVVRTRYWRPGWVESKSPRDCGDPTKGPWLRAEHDGVFYYAAPILAQLDKAARSPGAAKDTFDFAYSCEHMFGMTCWAPAKELRVALDRDDGAIAFDGRDLVVSYAPESYRDLTMRVEVSPRGQVVAVHMKHSLTLS